MPHAITTRRRGAIAPRLLATPMGLAMAALLDEGTVDLSARLTALGHGAAVASWAGDTGPLPVTPRALRRALGWRRVEALAEIAGLPAGEFLVRLARLLPQAVARGAREA